MVEAAERKLPKNRLIYKVDGKYLLTYEGKDLLKLYRLNLILQNAADSRVTFSASEELLTKIKEERDVLAKQLGFEQEKETVAKLATKIFVKTGIPFWRINP